MDNFKINSQCGRSLLMKIITHLIAFILGATLLWEALEHSVLLQTLLLQQSIITHQPSFNNFHLQVPSPFQNQIPNLQDLLGDDEDGVGELNFREDDKNIYFDLDVEDSGSTTVDTKVENGYLQVTGTTQKTIQEGNSESSFKSTFQRSVPLPENVDATKMQMIPGPGKVTFKFPKK